MNTTAQVKQAVKNTAQQLKQEPLELLKIASQQISGENLPAGNKGVEEINNEKGPDPRIAEEQRLKTLGMEQDNRKLQALEAELRDIRRLKIYTELMRKVQNGEDIPVDEFQELSSEQREVLKAQTEAVKNLNFQQQNGQSSLVIPVSKPGRQMRSGQKQSAQQQTTRVEKPVPPSG